jgi:predicted HTH transcriptional regulator
MDINTLQQILQSTENERIDFKQSHYFAKNGAEIDRDNPQEYKFIKDILAMANTPRQASAYIIIGIANDKTIVGVDYQIESRYLHDKFAQKCPIAPQFTVYPLRYENKELCIIEIPLVKYPYPCVVNKDLKKDFLERNRVYYRKGDKNEEADQLQIKKINNWLDGLPQGLGSLPDLK